MDHRRHRLDERIARQLALALTVMLVALLQSTLLPTILRTPINLVLVASVCWAMIDTPSHGALVGFYGGLILDILGHTPLGLHPLAILLVVGLVSLVTERLPGDNWLLALGLLALGTPLYHGIVTGLTGGGDWPGWALYVLVPALVVNLVLTLPMLLLIRWWHGRRSARLEW